MSDSTSIKSVKSKSIRIAWGVLLLIMALLGYLVPGTTLRFYDYPALFLFGLLGYWLFWGVVASLGVYLILKDGIKIEIPVARILLGLFVLCLGLGTFLSCLGNNHGTDVKLGDYFESLGASIVPDKSGAYPFDIKLGGGLFGYSLLLLFMLPKIVPLAFAFAVVIFLCGLVIIFFPEIVRFVRYLRAQHVLRKSRKERDKEPDTTALFEQESPSNDDLNTVYETPSLPNYGNAPEEGNKEEKAEQNEEQPALTRYELYHQAPDFGPDPLSPKPAPSFDNFSFENSNTQGLQEAIFSLDDDDTKPVEAVKEEALAPAEPESFMEEEDSLDVTPSFMAEEKAKVEENIPEVEIPTAPIETPIIPEVKEEVVIPEPPVEEPYIAPVEATPLVTPTPAPQVAPAVQEKVVEAAQLETIAPKKSVEEEWVTFGSVKQRAAKKRPAYTMPGRELLKTYEDDPHAAQNESDCLERTELINQAFRDLKVGAFVESHTIGPSVTRYNIKTDASVSISAVKRVVDDVMVRLGGVLGRFQDVVQGSSTSGLEIPNKVQSLVSFLETFDALPTDPKSNLYIPFGKSIEGKVVSADMSDFPHMLVSGSTGSGKSIFVHGLIMSLIMRNRPEDLKLVLVDPKRVEMGKYREIPHLLCPIIKEPTHAKVAMQKLCDEMERRYSLFEESNVSNIRQFNADVAPEKKCEKLPFIIVVIDEYADLVDTCKDIGEPIVRLAQKARAAGIHLVIATQRPDTNVINGRIKANIAVRVALSLSSATDSMTVLGEGGAEKLSGHGDMLVRCDSVSRAGFTRLQGCFVSNGEIKAVVDRIKEQQHVIYDPNFIDLEDHSNDLEVPTMVGPTAADVRKAADEDKYEMIKEAIMAQEYTSISQIQRTFGVGFPRAGKIFSRLQAEGIVAAKSDSPSSSKGCRVLIHNNTLSANPGSYSQSEVVPAGFPAPGDDY